MMFGYLAAEKKTDCTLDGVAQPAGCVEDAGPEDGSGATGVGLDEPPPAAALHGQGSDSQ